MIGWVAVMAGEVAAAVGLIDGGEPAMAACGCVGWFGAVSGRSRRSGSVAPASTAAAARAARVQISTRAVLRRVRGVAAGFGECWVATALAAARRRAVSEKSASWV